VCYKKGERSAEYIFLDRSWVTWDFLECEILALIRFGKEQEYGSRDVFFRVGGRWGCVGLGETIVGVGGGDVGGVSGITSKFLF
jgi:hypothetical protein